MNDIKHFTYKLKSRDDTNISGDFSCHLDGKKDKVFVIFPGMTGTTELYTYVRFRDFMLEAGYDVLILNSYSSCEKNGCFPRSLVEVSMQNHIDDFDDVVADLKTKYDKVYASGHSIGGRVLISSNNPNLSGQVLLDPSGDFTNEEYGKLTSSCFKKSEKWGERYIDWGDGVFIPIGKICEELRHRPFGEVLKEVKDLNVPTIFIAAGLYDFAKVYEKNLNNICKYVEIKDACHGFLKYGAIKEIAEKTLLFFA